MASQMAIFVRTRAFAKTLGFKHPLKTISTFAFLSQEAQLETDSTLSETTSLPPNPATGSPLYHENWRSPIPNTSMAQSLIPIGFLNQTPAYRIQALSQTMDVNSLMNLFADWITSQQWSEMKQLFESWIRSIGNDGKPNKPDVNLYNHYLRANVMIGASAGELLDLVAQMEDYSIVPNTASFNLVLKVMHQAKESEAAEKLLERMLVSGKESMPDDESYDLVIDMLFITEQIDAALKYIDLTLKSGYMVSMNLFSQCVKSCVNKGRLDTLVSIIERCKAMDQNKSLCPSWNMCNYIAEVATQNDNSKLALYSLEFMAEWITRGENARPSVLLSVEEGVIVAAFGTAGRTYNSTLLDVSWAILRRSLHQKKAPNSESYLAKIYALASLGNLQRALSTLHEFETVYANSNKESKDLFSPFSSLHPLVVACSKKGFETLDSDLFEESSNAALALFFFKWSEDCTGSTHSIRTVCTMIHILVSGNMNYRAVDLIKTIVVNINAEEELHDLVMKILHETHTERRVLHIVYSILVSCYVQANMIDMALKSITQMKCFHFYPTIGVCNSLLKALLGSELVELAWEILEEMQSHGIKINASIISLFISKYCAKGDIQSGWKLLMEMKNHGIKPDVVTYTIVIDSLCKISRLKEATSILFKMIQMGISPDSVLVSSVIDGYCKDKNPEKALNILKFFHLPPNIFVYHSFVSKFCTDGNMEKASELFFDMFDLGLLPDCFSYATIIGGYCKLKEKNKALNFLGKMLKRGIKPSLTIYTLLIDNSFKSGDMEMAELFYQNMIKSGMIPDSVLYNTLIDGYGKKGHVHKSFELLYMMRSSKIQPDTVTYNTIIQSLVKRGFLKEAQDLLDEITRRGFSPDIVTFTEMISGFSNKGNFEEAFLLWTYMSEHEVIPDVVTCSALINGYCKARLMEEAKTLFNKFIDAGLIPDLVLYNTLIHGFCNLGIMDDAWDMVSMMVKHGLAPNESTLRALVLGFEKKRATNPVQSVVFKLQRIFLQYGIHFDADHCLDMIHKPYSLVACI